VIIFLYFIILIIKTSSKIQNEAAQLFNNVVTYKSLLKIAMQYCTVIISTQHEIWGIHLKAKSYSISEDFYIYFDLLNTTSKDQPIWNFHMPDYYYTPVHESK